MYFLRWRCKHLNPLLFPHDSLSDNDSKFLTRNSQYSSRRLMKLRTNRFISPLRVGPGLFLHCRQVSWRTPVNEANRFIRPLRVGPDLYLHYTQAINKTKRLVKPEWTGPKGVFSSGGHCSIGRWPDLIRLSPLEAIIWHDQCIPRSYHEIA